MRGIIGNERDGANLNLGGFGGLIGFDRAIMSQTELLKKVNTKILLPQIVFTED